MRSPLIFFNPQAAPALLLLEQLRSFQKQDLESQTAAQLHQLKALLSHAYQHSPFWKKRLDAVGYNANSDIAQLLQTLTPLTRHDIQDEFDNLQAKWPGLNQDDIFSVASSGSTGKPVRVNRLKSIQNPLVGAYALLEGEWHKTDPNQTIAFLGFSIQNNVNASWGGIFQALNCRGRYITRSVAEASLQSHLDWLIREKPSYLKASPFVVAQLAQLALEQNIEISLKAVISQSEKVSATHRALCYEAFGARIIDRYSSEETGLISLQCPKHDHQHVMGASVIVEIVNEQGQPCAVGEVGRVLVTNLFSYAMPLIRYDLGDFASWGPACDCGIHLPVISKLWGRVRNAVIHADGSTHPMGFLGDDIGLMPNILEFRVRQYLGHELCLELVCKQPLSSAEVDAIRKIFIKDGLSGLWLYIKQVSSLVKEGNRKREEFEQMPQDWVASAECIKILV
jgi:phenylacetate-CoA ligase